MEKRSSRTARLMLGLAGSIGLLTAGDALAARFPAPADGNGARLRSASAPVYAFVELTQSPAAAQYATQLSKTRSVAKATSSAVSQLSAVRSQQATFAQALAAAQLPGVTEIYRLQRVSNAILYRLPKEHIPYIRSLPGVRAVRIVTPRVAENAQTIPIVNVPALWTNLGLPVHGEGIRVGVIDTGIDYTHANFGGPGTVAAYQAVNPNAPSASFPTPKVVGGWDFAGPIYDASSTDPAQITPQPDPNPIDYQGHGSHVSGTIAGYGVNADGTTYAGSYDQTFPATTFRIGPGAAPEASLYALKVFGDGGGSTNLDAAALEWAVDPNGDGDFSDHLDVVNLSLGSGYGTSNNSDAQIFTNAVNAGVVVVASAGNSSDVYFITGAPASTPEVISVAATSIGEYAALRVNSPVELAGMKPQAGSTPSVAASGLTAVTRNLVAVQAHTPTPNPSGATPAQGCEAYDNAAAVAGNIAFVQRGVCTFVVKVRNAEAAGAVGVVIWNNSANGDNLSSGMALDGTATIPARLIGNTDGTAISTALGSGAVNVTMDDSFSVTKPAELDQIASFTSRGPSRNKAGLVLKPDVAAPGVNIFSTGMGTGNGFAVMSGTSMAAPLTTGTVALLRQLHPTWSPAQLKALLMNTATHETYNKPAGATGRLPISPTRQGAGRIDGGTALGSSVVAYDQANAGRVSISFAMRDVAAVASEARTIELANAGATDKTYNVTVAPAVSTPGATVTPGVTTVTVPASGTATVEVTLSADPATLAASSDATAAGTTAITGLGTFPRSKLLETSGYVVFTDAASLAPTLRVPYLASLRPASAMGSAGRIAIHGTPAGTATLHPQGTGIGTAGLASYALPMELAFAQPQAWVDESDFARLAYVGVTSNLPDVGSVANAELYFGVNTRGIWGSPAEIAFQVMIKAAGSPYWQYAVVNDMPGADVNLTAIFAVDAAGNGTLLGYEDFVNGLPANASPVPVFLTDTMVLPVYAADVGLGSTASAIDYQVQVFTGDGLIDATPVLHYDLVHPAFATKLDTSLAAIGPTAPFVPDQAGTAIPVTFDTSAENGSNGVLLLHLGNAVGARAEEVAAFQPAQLQATTALAAGATCPAGGIEITTYWDDDANGALGANDTVVSVNDVCNGATGPTGPAGAGGPAGPKGGCGSSGAGASSLLTLLGLAALARRRRTSVA